MVLRIAICLLAVMLCGCGPSTKQLARQNFREAVAALKVCTSGSTYAEFRNKWMTLETCYIANQILLKEDEAPMRSLIALARATDNIWNLNNQIKAQTFVQGDWADSRKVIEQYASPTQLTYLKQTERSDKFPENYIQTGLSLISDRCDELLK